MLERQNRDTITAGWHREFLDLCRTAGLFILNGRTPRDILGEYTCLFNKCFSIVDYFLTTTDQLEGVKHLEVNCDEKYSGHKDAHSDHNIGTYNHTEVATPSCPAKGNQTPTTFQI
jgi:hypothetical protein